MPRTVNKKLFRVQISCDLSIPETSDAFLVGPCPAYIIQPSLQTLELMRRYRLRHKAGNGYVDVYYSGYLDAAGTTIDPFPVISTDEVFTFIVETTSATLEITDTEADPHEYFTIQLPLQRLKGHITRLTPISDATDYEDEEYEEYEQATVLLLRAMKLGIATSDQDIKVLKNRETLFIPPPDGETFGATEYVTLENINDDPDLVAVVAEGRFNKITVSDDPNEGSLQVSIPVEHLAPGPYIFKVPQYEEHEVRVYVDSKGELTRASAIIEVTFNGHIEEVEGIEIAHNYNRAHDKYPELPTPLPDPLPEGAPPWYSLFYYHIPIPSVP